LGDGGGRWREWLFHLIDQFADREMVPHIPPRQPRDEMFQPLSGIGLLREEEPEPGGDVEPLVYRTTLVRPEVVVQKDVHLFRLCHHDTPPK